MPAHAAHSAAPHNPFEPGHLFGHVQDADHFEVPKFLAPPDGIVNIPQPFLGDTGEGHVRGFKITKFMLIELVVAILIAAIFIAAGVPDAARARADGAVVEFAGIDAGVFAR